MARILVMAVLAAILTVASPVSSGEKMGYDISMRKGEKELHYKNIRELASMMKEVMVILKSLNHYPTDQQKKRLGEMISKTEEISKKKGAY